MPDYNIEITKMIKEGDKGNLKTEIWAEIKNKKTSMTMNKLIWWEDDNGTYHDGTPDLPTELRGMVDNAWIEKSRKW